MVGRRVVVLVTSLAGGLAPIGAAVGCHGDEFASSGDAATADAPAATDASDAVAANETGAPEGSTDDAALGAFACAALQPAPRLCDEFERGSAFAPPWDDSSTPGGGKLAIDGLQAAAGSSSLACTAPAPIGGGLANPGAALLRSFTLPAEDVRLEMDWSIAALPSATSYVLATIAFGPVDGGTGGTYNVQLDAEPAGVVLHESDYRSNSGGDFYKHVLSRQPLLGQWQRVQLHVTLAGAGAPHVTLRIGSNVVVDDALTVTDVVSGSPTLTVGILYNASPEQQTVHYDDVALFF